MIQPGAIVKQLGIRRRRSVRLSVHPWTRGPWYRARAHDAPYGIGITCADLEKRGYGAPNFARALGYAVLMITRFRTYAQNRGPYGLLTWGVVLAILIWNQFRFFTTTAALIILPIMGLCLIAPLAIMPLCERNPARAARVQNTIWNILLVYIVLSFFNLFVPPVLVSLGVILFVFFMFGWGFWFYSSPAVVTNRRYEGMQAHWLEREEAALAEEVEANQRELDAMDDPRGSRGH